MVDPTELVQLRVQGLEQSLVVVVGSSPGSDAGHFLRLLLS